MMFNNLLVMAFLLLHLQTNTIRMILQLQLSVVKQMKLMFGLPVKVPDIVIVTCFYIPPLEGLARRSQEKEPKLSKNIKYCYF